MDIIDIMLARALTPQGSIEQYAAQANKAVTNANKAVTTANNAAAAAETASQEAQQALEEFNTITNNLTATIETTASEITDNKIAEAMNNVVTETTIEDDNTNSYKSKKLKVRKKGILNSYNLMKNYTSTGNNEDGSMTQKAITEALSSASGGSTNLGSNNNGKIVIIDKDGNIVAGDVQEQAIIDTLIRSGAYDATNAVGLEVDYVNRGFVRVQEAIGLAQGTDFDRYVMYGGRRRCIVDRSGRIVAWYGDTNYKEDGSLGQVMVYQPKFYYNRTVSNYETSVRGKIINKEIIIISPTEQPGFKLHPLFKDESGNEIDYILLSAYESCYFDASKNAISLQDGDIDSSADYLLSIAGAKPVTGATKNFTVEIAERMAKNIGTGWHITNMQAESANQMLEIVEFGQLNGQRALEAGIVNINSTASVNGASITGSTSSLGNITGAATSTVNEINGTYNTYNQPGYRAISYRGFENPWGNLYRFIGGVNLYGDGNMGSGMAYIAKDYNYTPGRIGENYENVGFQISRNSAWISAMGYGKADYDWVFLPISAEGANSLVPVGDFVWVEANINGSYNISVGGTQRQGDNCGMFYYACDQQPNSTTASQSARIMHIPTKDSAVYLANIASWTQQMEG